MALRCNKSVIAVAAFIVGMLSAATGEAQVATWHLHNEASTTSGFKQLKSAGPDVAQATLQTAALQGVGTGEKQIAQFDTASGVPNTAGKIPTGATVSAVVWLRKTANFGTMFPRIKVYLNSSGGSSICTATGDRAHDDTHGLHHHVPDGGQHHPRGERSPLCLGGRQSDRRIERWCLSWRTRS